MNNHEVIAKFGGSSVAQPELVRQHIELDDPPIVVVSAPGVDRRRNLHTKLTQLLLGATTGAVSIQDIEQRVDLLADDMGIPSSVPGTVSADVGTWQAKSWPVEALGEYWSAQLYAEYLDREFVDAGEVIRLRRNGEIDLEASERLSSERFEADGRYIVPGFYGRDDQGDVRTLGFGGSDVSPAVIARALRIVEYHNWSDVDGFMTADPSVVSDARLISELTYEEVEELDCGLLHVQACQLLLATTVRTVMRNTFGEIGNRGTIIESSHYRAHQAATNAASKEVLLVHD